MEVSSNRDRTSRSQSLLFFGSPFRLGLSTFGEISEGPLKSVQAEILRPQAEPRCGLGSPVGDGIDEKSGCHVQIEKIASALVRLPVWGLGLHCNDSKTG